MGLAIFDLDNTLIGGDSDYLWGQFLCRLGVVEPEYYRQEHDRYYREYLAGSLDIYEFLRFQLAPLARFTLAELQRWRLQFLEQEIQPVLLPRADTLLQRHRELGDRLLIITATNRFITEPIAGLLGVADLIATDPEIIGDRYTGEVAGVPSYAQGKVTRLREWLAERGLDLDGSSFYSDSHNDLPLLSLVANAVAVDPDPLLRAVAAARGWPVISLR
jgi:HAD superfamily hydrolase (TIGR01490 family)